MHQITVSIKNLKDLRGILSNDEVLTHSERSQSILAMVYTAYIDKSLLESISQIILGFSAKVTLVGATTTGEIDNGKTITRSTTITLLFLEATSVVPITIKSELGDEEEMAMSLRHQVLKISPKAVMLLTTPLSSDVSVLIQNFTKESFAFEVFGGGAGDYAHECTLLLSGTEVFTSGVVAICFIGSSFQLKKHTFVGWSPMSKEMTATRAQGNTLFTIDDKPAFDIYTKYLNIKDDSEFFANAIGFPLLTKTKGDYLAKVPVSVGSDGSLAFISSVREGETFRLGFFNPEIIKSNLQDIKSSLNAFTPEAIFLFTCGCRRFALADDIQLETQYLADIAPVSGFYTIGEFCDIQGEVPQMNLAFIAVGMKESITFKPHKALPERKKKISSDKFLTSHMTVVGRLLYFINVLNEELEQQAITDGLTHLYNRRHFDAIFSATIRIAKRHNKLLCFLMMDVDYFKQYNDYYGHQAGDKALIKVAHCLKKNAQRADDYCFRLGGEEFGVLYKAENKDHALSFANMLRKSIENMHIEHEKSEISSFITVSIGLACKETNTISNESDYYKEADDLLYQAKKSGRNRVKIN
ncbi:hypothetical protein CKO42_24285 [Lamprobacter modestohalophilus]|uniref:diguanylate cyclase n=1 Tax=Lamprobacter modestohalophilus TaxID=1064514 RepID=A0A9X0WDM3_9GAMM|nr:hypothetical protein [Lamprobacter modestohalophilus]